MGERFKHNLLAGTEDKQALILNRNDETDQELRKMFHAPNVLQRDILDFISRQRADGVITQARLEEIYDYTFGCYNVNISAYLNDKYASEYHNYNCLLSSEARHMPIHLESTIGNKIVSADHLDFDKLRPISYWAFDDDCLSLLSTEAFLDLRKRMQKLIDEDLMMVFRTGNITHDNYYNFVEYWNDFASQLERSTMSVMYNDHVKIDEELKKMNKYMSAKERLQYLKNEGMKNDLVEIVNVVLSSVPIIGSVASYSGLVLERFYSTKEISECVTNIPREDQLKERNSMLSTYLENKKTILTKYQPNFQR